MNQRTARLSPDDGLFRLAGTDSSWIWVHTCPTPRCPCRSALVLATHDGRETLEARGAPVWQAWMAESGHYREVARTIRVTGYLQEQPAQLELACVGTG